MAETIVNIHEAKTHLSRLIERAEAGETIVIAKAGTPKVTLTLYPRSDRRGPGRFSGQIELGGAFSDPLPEENLSAWEGAPQNP